MLCLDSRSLAFARTQFRNTHVPSIILLFGGSFQGPTYPERKRRHTLSEFSDLALCTLLQLPLMPGKSEAKT